MDLLSCVFEQLLLIYQATVPEFNLLKPFLLDFDFLYTVLYPDVNQLTDYVFLPGSLV